MATSRSSAARTIRIATLALVAWLVLSALPQAAAQPAGTTPTLDLAALVLMPADLEAVGMTGFGTDWSMTMASHAEVMAPETLLQSRVAVPPADVPDVLRVLDASGWVRIHELMLAKPVDPDDPDWYHTAVSSSIEEYASPEGAAAAFAAFSSEAALLTGDIDLLTVRAVTTPLGDERMLAHGQYQIDGGTDHSLVMMVRVDRRIVSVTVQDYGNQIEPDQATIEQLTGRVVTRLQAASASGASVGPCLPGGITSLGSAIEPTTPQPDAPYIPGLDRCVQRLVGDVVYAEVARYLMLDGVAIRIFHDSDASLAEYQTEMTSRGVTDVYRSADRIDDAHNYLRVDTTISTYPDSQTAAADFAGAEQRLRDDPEFSGLVFTPNSHQLGDESHSYSYTRTKPDGTSTATATGTTIRLGDMVVTVRTWDNNAGEPIPDVVNTLLTSQVACMQANDCTAPIPVPPELIEGA